MKNFDEWVECFDTEITEHFNALNIPEPTHEEVIKLYSNYGKSWEMLTDC